MALGAGVEELRGTDPRRIGPYELVGVLGSGGMGRVYLGRTRDGVAAAVKVIHADLARDPEFRRRFRREVETTAAITGPRLAAVLDSDVDAEHPWLATEYVAGPSLTTAVTDRGPLRPEAAIRVAAGVAEALAAIHAQGLVHRDVKPSNVLLASDGPRLIDFGIARGATDSRLTRTGVALGTPQFMAPEQIQGDRETGASADLFALAGVLLYAMTGEYPFGEGSAVTLLYRIVHEAPRLQSVRPDLRPLLAACLDKDPEARPSAVEMVRQLRQLADPERTVEVATAATDQTVPVSAVPTQAVVTATQSAMATESAMATPYPPYPSGPMGPGGPSIGPNGNPNPKSNRWRKPTAIGAGVTAAIAALVVAITLGSGDGGSTGTTGAGKVANEIPDPQASSLAPGAGVILPNGSTSSGATPSQGPATPGQTPATPGKQNGSPANGSAPGATTAPTGTAGPSGTTSKPGSPASGTTGASQPKGTTGAPASHTTAPPASTAGPTSAATSSAGSGTPSRVSSDGPHTIQSAYDSKCVTAAEDAGSKWYVAGSCGGTPAQWKVWHGTATQAGLPTWQFESTYYPGYCMSAAWTLQSQNWQLVPCSAGDKWQWWAGSAASGSTRLDNWQNTDYCLVNNQGIDSEKCADNRDNLPTVDFYWSLK